MGTLINVAAIIIASFLGLFLKKRLNEDIQKGLLFALGLGLMVLSIGWFLKDFLIINEGAIATHKELLIIVSLVLGTLIGTYLKLDERLNTVMINIETKYKLPPLAKGFVAATIIFCVGAMAILGSIQDGLYQNYDILVIKSVLDFITAMMLASIFGIGVIFSAISVFIYQGSLTLLASRLDTFLTPEMIIGMSMVGNILLVAIAIDFMALQKVKVLNMLPAIFIPLFYEVIIALF
ncbi:MAG: DUF554 domain-containing protein [Acholeplasmataceae bacterium]